MGWLKRGIGIAEVAAGALTWPAGASLVAKGGADVATSFGNGKKPGVSVPSQTRSVDVGNVPPMPTIAKSLPQDRIQRRSRMKTVYGY